MSLLMLPTRPQTRLAILIQVLGRIQQENREGRLSQLSELASRLSALASELSPALDRLEDRKKNRIRTSTAKKERIQILTRFCRDFLSVNAKRAGRSPVDKGLNAFFQVKPDLFVQAKAKPLVLLKIAQNLIDSEAAAVAAGFEPSLNPSVAELIPLLTGMEALITEADTSDSEIAEAQMALNQRQAQAVDLLREVSGHLRVVYRKLPAPTRRNMLRSFGFNFRKESNRAEGEGTEADADGTPDTDETPETPAPQQSQTTKPRTCDAPSARRDHAAA